MIARRSLATVAVLAIVVGLVGCSGPGKPAASKPTVLRMAHVDDNVLLDPAAQYFIDRVDQVSHGTLEIKLVGECCGRDTNNAQQLVQRVAAGDYDLGWAWTRGLEDLGITTFQGLSAPRLIDSYALEKSTLSTVNQQSILAGLASLNFKYKPVGIALEPGTLRRPIDTVSAVRDQPEWLKTTFWSNKSTIADATIKALGATSTQVKNDDRDTGLMNGTIDGAENSVAWQAESQHVQQPVLMSNEALWARIDVLLASKGTLSKLTTKQKEWITESAKYVSGLTDKVAALDESAVNTVCNQGGHFATVSQDQLHSDDTNLAPEYAVLRANQFTRMLIDRIEKLKPPQPPQEYTIDSKCLITLN